EDVDVEVARPLEARCGQLHMSQLGNRTTGHDRCSPDCWLVWKLRGRRRGRLSIGAVGVEGDAHLRIPAATPRVADAGDQTPDLVEVDSQLVAVLHRALTLRRGLDGDHVTGVQRHDRRGQLDDRADLLVEVLQTSLLPRLAIARQLEPDALALVKRPG